MAGMRTWRAAMAGCGWIGGITAFLLLSGVAASGADRVMGEGAKPWSDRDYIISGFPESVTIRNPVPEQKCSGYRITIPAGARSALVALLAGDAAAAIAARENMTPLGKSFQVAKLRYDLYLWPNPKPMLDCSATKSGGILLAVDGAAAAGTQGAPAAEKTSVPPVVAVASASGRAMGEGAKPWSDRDHVISGFPEGVTIRNPVPEQKCSGYRITIPAGARSALVALLAGDAAAAIAARENMTPLGKSFQVAKLRYDLYLWPNPKPVLDCSATKSGGILLAVDEDIAAAHAPVTPAAAVPSATNFSLNGMHAFAGQPSEFDPSPREVVMYVRQPSGGVNANTGIMLLLHNWGGTWKMTAPWCDVLSDKYNLITVSVDYLQSGSDGGKTPYDHGLFQAMDCLRAVYEVREKLKAAGVPFDQRRLFAAGGSGGGNVSQMVNKLAPQSFNCIVDICGMPGLTDDIAFGRGKLNARYSSDPASPYYLSPARKEIRDPGNPVHLANQKKVHPDNKVIIIHGQKDDYCPVSPKIEIFNNMIRAGFEPSGYFLAATDIDGVAVTNIGHGVGDRLAVIIKYGGETIAENGKYALRLRGPSDFELKHKVEFPVTGGRYIVDFAAEPSLVFEQQ